MSPPPQPSRSATGGLIGSIFGRKPESRASQKLLRCHLRAAGARYHIWRERPSSKPVGRYLCGTWQSGAGPVGWIPPALLRNGCFDGFSPVRPPMAALFAHIPGSGSPRLGQFICRERKRDRTSYSRAQRNITFSEHAASSTSINATCSRSPANLRIGLMM